MKCRHCGKEYDDSFSYCPYCAEPKPITVMPVSNEEKIKKQNNNVVLQAILGIIIAFIPSIIIVYLVEFFFLIVDVLGAVIDEREILFDISWFSFDKVSIIALCTSLLFGILYIFVWLCKSKREKLIDVQFSEDQKSICPVCGSHSVALGRKGYDWNKGFWYRMFNIKGGHYLAGAESRRVTAHCQNCGHSWLTDEEWIK